MTPRDALHLARLRYVKRLLTHCPAILWAYLRDVETIEDSWIFHLRASFAWLARFSATHFGLTGDSTFEDWLIFVAADQRWKGRLKRAAQSCRTYRSTHAETDVWQSWLSHSLSNKGVSFGPLTTAAPALQWTCELCERNFASKRALAMHAAQVHAYQTLVKHFATDGLCPNCARDYHSRARLCAHLRVAEGCLERIRASFPPLAGSELDALNIADRLQARALKEHGWLPTKAQAPVCRAFGPALPPAGSSDANLMLQRWTARHGPAERPQFDGLQGVCLVPRIEEDVPQSKPHPGPMDADISFIMHSTAGSEHGADGVFSMGGLSRLYAQLHIKTLCFVHFFSGHRRCGDLQHQIESHVIQEHTQLFCLSIDFCLQGEDGNLVTSKSRAFWTQQIKSGAIIGCGGGPPCETYTAARLLPGGPPPLRTYDEPLGLPSNNQRQWKQTLLGTVLMQFITEMVFLCACVGGCAFIEHPSYPTWARNLRPSSTWSSLAMRWLKRLNCTSVVTFDQCIYGCKARKPTTLMLIRLPHLRDSILGMGRAGRCAHPDGFHVGLQGKDSTGQYRTAVAKIYPEAMNLGIANAVATFTQHLFDAPFQHEALNVELLKLARLDFVSREIVQPDFYLDV